MTVDPVIYPLSLLVCVWSRASLRVSCLNGYWETPQLRSASHLFARGRNVRSDLMRKVFDGPSGTDDAIAYRDVPELGVSIHQSNDLIYI